MLQRGEIDVRLDAEISRVGGFSTLLSVKDRRRLRNIVREVHLKHYPQHLITNYECDRIIDVIAPETAAYLIRLNMDGVSR
jgi:hypothetical protein